MHDLRRIKLNRELRNYFINLKCVPISIIERPGCFYWVFRELHNLSIVFSIDDNHNITKLMFNDIAFKLDLDEEHVDLVCSIIKDVYNTNDYNINNIMLR